MGGQPSHRVPIDLRGLSAREDIFTVSRASRRDPAVAAWLDGEPGELRTIARRWFMQMRDCGDDVRELMHDGCPVACIDTAPFAYVNAFKAHVNLGFFNGAALQDPAGLLEGSGKRMRHVKLLPGRPVNADALRDLINAAYQDLRRRLGGQGTA